MRATDPLKFPTAPMPVCGQPEVEADFKALPLDWILDQLLGYSKYPFLAVNDLEVPDCFSDARPEALHEAVADLASQLRDLLPTELEGVGELACLRCLDCLDGLYRSMSPHLFKMGYLFGRRQADWDGISLYTMQCGQDGL